MHYIAKRQDGSFETLVNNLPFHVTPNNSRFAFLSEKYPDLPPGMAMVGAMKTRPVEREETVTTMDEEGIEHTGTVVHVETEEYFDGELMEDHRRTFGWLNGEAHEVTEFGPLPEGFSETPPLEVARAAKIARIDAETSAAILAGFDYAIDGQTVHFSYDTNDQQNFADTANAATLATLGVPGVPSSVTWNGWNVTQNDVGNVVSRSLVRLVLDPAAFLAFYMGGALVHKATQIEIGGQRKAAAEEAQTLEDLEAV